MICARKKNILVARQDEQWHSRIWTRGLFPVGRQVIRSVNGGGPDGLATVGCGQAVGSPKGEAPAASATQRCKQSPTSPLRRQARVRKPGSAPRFSLVTDGTAPSLASAAREWSYVRSPKSHQGSSSRELQSEGERLEAVSTAQHRLQTDQNSERAAKNQSRRLSPKNLRVMRTTPFKTIEVQGAGSLWRRAG